MKTLHCYVRKQFNRSGTPRFRYSVGRTDFSQKDLEGFDQLWFRFSTKTTKEDRIAVCERWKHKILLPEHKLYYLRGENE